ncbi:MAG: LEA type 2 family protein [Planctomycetota bacterium]|jgi:hypothetical protein
MRFLRQGLLRGALLVVGLLSLPGCTRYRSPEISLARVMMTESGDEALALGFEVELANPNVAPLELDEFRYTVEIDGREVYAGRRAAGATLSAAQTRRLTIPAVVPYHRMGWTAGPPPQVTYALRGALRYRTPSELAQQLFDAGVRRPRTSFGGRGQVALQKPP